MEGKPQDQRSWKKAACKNQEVVREDFQPVTAAKELLKGG